MKKKWFLAMALAVLVPAFSYLVVKYYGERAIKMPGRYFFDDVVEKTERGKTVMDTVWHKVKNEKFVNQLGQQVQLDDLKGKIIVVDFFFTRCPNVCPRMTESMKKLQRSFRKNDSIVQFLSISVDPEHDSVPRLKTFADRFKVDHSSWWLLTGDKRSIYDFALKELKANVADVNIDTAFVHTDNFFLLDKERVVRGWYNGLDSVEMAQLARDIPLLRLEKNKKRTFGEFLKELFNRS
jgi:protein SCO1